MVLIGSTSFLEPHRSCKKCAPSHKSILWNIFVTKKSVLWNIIDTLSPFDSRRSNVHSIFDTSYSFLIWLFTFTAAIVVAFHRDGNSFAFVSSWFSLLSFIIFWSHSSFSGYKHLCRVDSHYFLSSIIFWSHSSFSGYKCWTARVRYDYQLVAWLL